MTTPAVKTHLSRRSVVPAAGALALLCVLFTLGRPLRAAEHDTYRTRLRKLRVQSGELEQDILRAHMGLPEVHGTAPERLAELRARAAELRGGSSR